MSGLGHLPERAAVGPSAGGPCQYLYPQGLPRAGVPWSHGQEPPRTETNQENIGAADVHLSDEDLRTIQSAAARIQVVGDRYPNRCSR